MTRSLSRAALLAAAALLAGCAAPHPLMPTPDLYAAGVEAPYPATLPEELRTSQVEIFFATDRTPEPRDDGRPGYGIGRSSSLAVGHVMVDIGEGAGWDTLLDDAHTGERERALNLDVVSVTEIARTPTFPVPYQVVDGLPVIDPKAQQAFEAVASDVARSLRRPLERSPRRELLLYVHGVANTFDEALITTAELWHYMGREFVPVAFTWPAGKGGLLRGYTYDRESSEFAVFHFKHFLNWLSRLPEVDGIHIISHSRGTDVVATGIRELVIEALARGEPPAQRYKLRNVVLAAPDINLEVTMMRTVTEFFGAAMDRLTLYTSPRDKAIGISEFLFGGGLRLGGLDFRGSADDPQAMHDLREVTEWRSTNHAIIEYLGERGGAHGHSYFRANPAVSSDLVLTVRFGRAPGAANGRPLKHNKGMFWEIDDDYVSKFHGP